MVNASMRNEAPLFAYTTEGGGWEAWSRDDMLNACNEIWARVGLESVLGHSFRIGNTTELLLQGISPDIVAAQGRWKSRASFLRYWRKIDSILPTFLRVTPTVLSSVRASVAAFERNASLCI